ncbi:endoribonuclease L-PSP domain protein [Bordetella bronchiseptica SBL-F6116]|nr:endoribonuclease L-PSP domain protein [Bordetella bronchiseptica OSU054]KDD42549.1 endoribonuclease L-PSP domain protein [Bordetella bronchiseptica MBORD901]KDD44149.1 endoribonuclease L-PSP domain protein [Bordetella bronchiseptica OSU095]KDD96743.1 endoribonuclease L-PSP domain protein [Bordetella bronchiseptica SBL-F6116]
MRLGHRSRRLDHPHSRFAQIWAPVPESWGQAPPPTLPAVGVTWLYGFDFELTVIAKLPQAGEG